MARYRLYGYKLTGSCAVEAALAEAGIAYDFIPINTKAGEARTESFKKINPRQQVPVLQHPDGSIITEGPAILTHLADAHPAARLIPPPGSSTRAQHDRWMAFFQANVYEGELRQLFPERYVDDPVYAPTVQRAADSYVEHQFRMFDKLIQHTPYFFGNMLTMLDIYVWMLAQWVDQEWMGRECPGVKKLSDAVAQRPKIAPVHQYHFG